MHISENEELSDEVPEAATAETATAETDNETASLSSEEKMLAMLSPEARIEVLAELDAISDGMREALEIAHGFRKDDGTPITKPADDLSD